MKKNVRILLAALIVSLCMGGLTACGKTDSGQLESGKSLKEGDVAPGVSKGRFRGVKGTVHLSYISYRKHCFEKVKLLFRNSVFSIHRKLHSFDIKSSAFMRGSRSGR